MSAQPLGQDLLAALGRFALGWRFHSQTVSGRGQRPALDAYFGTFAPLFRSIDPPGVENIPVY